MKKIICIFLLLALLLAGCSQGKTDYTPTGGGLYQGETTLPASPPISADQKLSLVYYPEETLNPYLCADYTNRTLFSLLYQSLYALNPEGEAQSMLCSGYQLSWDKKTHVFSVEKATFADGTTLTAADVALSLEAARKGRVYSGRFTYIDQISVTADGERVQITTTIPYENLPLLLDVPIVKGSQTGVSMPMGTGPYRLEQNSSGCWLRLRLDWWCRAELPLTAAKIPLIAAQSARNIRDEFELGQVGVVCANPGSDNYADFRCDSDLWDCENGIFLYLGCRSRSTVFSGEAVRSALISAIDRQTLCRDIYRSFAQPAVLPASPDFAYYDEALASQYPFNPDLLRQALEAENLLGQEVRLLVNRDDGRRVRAAQAIAKMLEECGLKVTLRQLSGDSYTKALSQGSYDLHLGQTVLSPNMDLSAFYKEDGALSYGGMSDTGIYALCQQALSSSANYKALHQAVLDDAVLCPVAFLQYAVYGQRGLVDGLTPARDFVFYYSLGKTVKPTLLET